jgi:8-oxo-dGTP diphosphatase
MEIFSPGHLQVTAALIPLECRLFIAQRPPHKKNGLLWEFPGGKADKGERLEEALAREIREELGWRVEVRDLFLHVHHDRNDLGIDLFAFWCSIEEGELSLREHVDCCWALPRELRLYRFTEADIQLISPLENLERLPEYV